MKNLAYKLVKKLKKKRLNISLAESCTGGNISSLITSISGSSEVFNFSVISYSNKSKILILRVPKNTIDKYGAVSKEVCLSMVKNLSRISKNKISLSVTGIAGPDGGTSKKPVGLVFIGLKINSYIKIKRYLFKNKTRHLIQKAATKKALELIINSIK